jgi:hypothetical protein
VTRSETRAGLDEGALASSEDAATVACGLASGAPPAEKGPCSECQHLKDKLAGMFPTARFTLQQSVP